MDEKELNRRELLVKSIRAANTSYDKFAKGKGSKYLGGAKSKDELQDRIYEGLVKAYPPGEVTEQELAKVKAADDIDLSNAVLNDKDPLSVKEKVDFSAFKPLVEDDKWYGMEVGDPFTEGTIQNKMVELGYDPTYDKSAQRFWNDLNRHSTNYNRAKTVDDFANSGLGVAMSLVAPSAYQEAVKQAMTDAPLDEGAVWKQYATDAAINSLMAGTAPALAANPIAAGFALSAEELARQGLKKYFDPELEFSPEEAATAGITGGTLPSTVQRIGSTLAKVPNQSVRRFGKDFLRGARGYDPVIDEKAALKEALITARHPEKASTSGFYSQVDRANENARDKAETYLRALGFGNEVAPDPNIGSEAFREYRRKRMLNIAPEQEVTLSDMLDPEKLSDKEMLKAFDKAYEGDYGKNFADLNSPSTGQEMDLEQMFGSGKGQNLKDELKFRDQSARNLEDRIKMLETYYPVRTAKRSAQYTDGSKAARLLFGDMSGVGSAVPYALGRTAGSVMGTVEPILKVNPFTTNKSQDYRNEEWFIKLLEKDPEAADAIRAILGKKKRGL
jgi:hypothetical protein